MNLFRNNKIRRKSPKALSGIVRGPQIHKKGRLKEIFLIPVLAAALLALFFCISFLILHNPRYSQEEKGMGDLILDLESLYADQSDDSTSGQIETGGGSGNSTNNTFTGSSTSAGGNGSPGSTSDSGSGSGSGSISHNDSDSGNGSISHGGGDSGSGSISDSGSDSGSGSAPDGDSDSGGGSAPDSDNNSDDDSNSPGDGRPSGNTNRHPHELPLIPVRNS